MEARYTTRSLVLEAAEPPLHDHVVDPAGLAVHALEHVVGRQQPLVGSGVEDGGRPVLREGRLHAGAHAGGAHVVSEPPGDDEAGAPVDRAGQAHMRPRSGCR